MENYHFVSICMMLTEQEISVIGVNQSFPFFPLATQSQSRVVDNSRHNSAWIVIVTFFVYWIASNNTAWHITAIASQFPEMLKIQWIQILFNKVLKMILGIFKLVRDRSVCPWFRLYPSLFYQFLMSSYVSWRRQRKMSRVKRESEK